MAKCREIYFRDMGNPIQILTIAKTIARFNGRQGYLTGRNAADPDGNHISVKRLRPEEKLHQQMLMDDEPTGAAHKRIVRDSFDALEMSSSAQHL